MSESTTLHAKRLNHGQSEIYLEDAGKESAHRTLATNEVRNVIQKLCTAEAFDAFYAALFTAVGSPATLTATNMDAIAAELKLAL